MTAGTGQVVAVDAPAPALTPAAVRRWLPFASVLAFVVAVLVAADTSLVDIARYALYAVLAVALPGTLVYRAVRRTPHTFVEDVALGVAVGLLLELAGWATWSALGLQDWLWLWPVSVIVPFAVLPSLRRHWRVRGYLPTPVGWSWSVAGVVAFFTAYLSVVFLERNPVLPTSEGTRQYLDLAYQQSLAADAKHHFPPGLPQVAGEPLHYHWFGYPHLAASSLIGQVDLPVVMLRFAVPALCAAAVVLAAVVGWRVSGRPYVGVGTAVLFFVVGEVNFTHPVLMPFGTQATFVIWHGLSMIYSWVLLLALIAVLADVLARPRQRRPAPVAPGDRVPAPPAASGDRPAAVASGDRVPAIGPGAYALAAVLLVGSAGAKASSVPVVALALAFTAAVLLVTRRRLPWPVLGLAALAAGAQLFAMAVLFSFESHGVTLRPWQGFAGFTAAAPDRPEWRQWLVATGVLAAFLVNMQLRQAGIIPLLWLRRWRLEPVRWFLLGGAVAGPALYLTFGHASGGNQYFTRAGFTFGVIGSAWGFALVLDRARLSPRGRLALGAFALAFAVVLTAGQLRWAGQPPVGQPYSSLLPLLRWATGLALVGVLAALAWTALSFRWPALRGCGAVVALTAILVTGAPGLVMDAKKSWESPNGGAYYNVPMPRSRVEAARWVRDHSGPEDILATNAHCLWPGAQPCFAASFWLSAYAERRVLVEGWAFAPRLVDVAYAPFWDQRRLQLNDQAFTSPSAEGIRLLKLEYGVRWLVVDRSLEPESPALSTVAALRFDNGRLAVYELP